MKCPNCGTENNSANIKCIKCGTQLINEEEYNEIYSQNQEENKSEHDRMIEDAKIETFASIYGGIGATIAGLIFSGVCFRILLASSGNSKFIIIPFLICGLAVLIRGIIMIYKGINVKKASNSLNDGNLQEFENLKNVDKKLSGFDNIGNHIYLFGFLLFWFVFLIFFDYQAIKTWSSGGSTMFLFSLIFWVAGFTVLFSQLK